MIGYAPRGWLLLVAGLILNLTAGAAITVPQLTILPPGDQLTISSDCQAGALLRPGASSNFTHWQEAGRLHDAMYAFPDPAPLTPRRFYRVLASARTAAEDWKNQILFPEEVFLPAVEGEAVRWVKFIILTSEPGRVYYQDSTKSPFVICHLSFVTGPSQGKAPAMNANAMRASLVFMLILIVRDLFLLSQRLHRSLKFRQLRFQLRVLGLQLPNADF